MPGQALRVPAGYVTKTGCGKSINFNKSHPILNFMEIRSAVHEFLLAGV
jgi:hypothetical protein